MNNIEICNLALGRIGAKPIASLTEETQEARYCNVFFHAARQAALRDYPWNFCASRKALGQVTLPDVYPEWSYAYAYPAACLQVRRLFSDGSLTTEVESFDSVLYTDPVTGQQSRLLLTNVETAVAEFTADVTDPSFFDSQFVEVFAAKLAMLLAMPITRSKSIQSDAAQAYVAFLPIAKRTDSQEGSVAQTAESPWGSDRFGAA